MSYSQSTTQQCSRKNEAVNVEGPHDDDMPDVDQFLVPPPSILQTAVEPNAPNVLGNRAPIMSLYLLSLETKKAEIYWALKVVLSHHSYLQHHFQVK